MANRSAFDETVRAALLDRLRALRADSSRAWGTMSAHQAVCHLSDGFRMALGDRAVAPFGSKLARPFMRIIAFHLPMRWPQGVQTMPEIEQGGGGTPPEEFERDRKELIELLETFGSRGRKADWPEHPIFGRMSGGEWGIWAYRHMDHHLRQFHA